ELHCNVDADEPSEPWRGPAKVGREAAPARDHCAPGHAAADPQADRDWLGPPAQIEATRGEGDRDLAVLEAEVGQVRGEGREPTVSRIERAMVAGPEAARGWTRGQAGELSCGRGHGQRRAEAGGAGVAAGAFAGQIAVAGLDLLHWGIRVDAGAWLGGDV